MTNGLRSRLKTELKLKMEPKLRLNEDEAGTKA
jgi:hypothetical protein